MKDYTFLVSVNVKLLKEITVSAENEDDAFELIPDQLTDEDWKPADKFDVSDFTVESYSPEDEDDEDDTEVKTEEETL